MDRNKLDWWERRGPAIYTEPNPNKPGAAKLVADLYPLSTYIVQTIVDRHNAALEKAIK